jgi:hypothetical protein
MNAFLYATSGPWMGSLKRDFKNSNKPYIQFTWLWFSAQTLKGLDKDEPFWLYFYYTKKSESNPNRHGFVLYRAHIIEHSYEPFESGQIMDYYDPQEGNRIWFKCDFIDDVKKLDGSLITIDDLIHANGVTLAYAIRNSIAPIVPPHVKVVQRTGSNLV